MTLVCLAKTSINPMMVSDLMLSSREPEIAVIPSINFHELYIPLSNDRYAVGLVKRLLS